MQAMIATITSKLQDGVKLYELTPVLDLYTASDYREYIRFDFTKYTRNVVFSNDLIDVIVICWLPGQESASWSSYCWPFS